MKSMDLLDAIGEARPQYVADAKKPVKHRSVKRTMLMAAVITVSTVALLAVTAFAAKELSGWFQMYFSERSQLTQEQKDFLDENVVEVAPGQTGLTVEAALTDGIQIFLKLHVTAPEDVVLLPENQDHVRGYSGNDDDMGGDIVTLDGKNITNCGIRFLPVEDGDGRSNTMDYMGLGMLQGDYDEKTHEQIPLDLKNKTLKIHIQDFYQYVSNQDYSDLDKQLVVKGDWTFDFPVEEDSITAVELLKEPVKASLEYLDMEAEEKTYARVENTRITSVMLRPLSLDITYEVPGNLQVSGSFGEKIKAVMKDQSEVQLRPQWGGSKTIRYFASGPVIFEQLDHILLGDGTVIPVS